MAKLTYKQIEAARETRMWITQIVVPIFVATIAIPDIREPLVNGVKNAYSNLKRKFIK